MKRIATILMLAFCLDFSQAETIAFSVESAVDFALKENLNLRAARKQIAIAESSLKWSGKLADPDFEIGGSIDQFGLNDNESMWEVAIAQKFPLTRRLSRERDLSEADLALAQAEVRVHEWNLEADVRETAIDALALKNLTELQDQLRGVAENVAGAVKSAFQKAEASQLDVTEAKLEVRARIAEIQRLKAREITISGKLRGLLGLGPESAPEMSGRLEAPSGFPTATATNEVLSRRPDLQLHVLREGRAEAAVALAKSQRWQDVAVRLFMEREASVDEPNGLERNTFLGMGLSFQLPLRTPEERLTSQPRGELAAAKASTAALAAQIRNEIATSNETVSGRHQIWAQASGETLELARQHVDEMREAWEHSNVSLSRLQQAQDRALNLETIAVESLREYYQALAQLKHAAVLP